MKRSKFLRITGTTIIAASGVGYLLSDKKTGKRMQRLFLKVRERSLALHPMTQILEEPSMAATVNQSIGIGNNIQFILRMGYLKSYPKPVSLRRPVDWFVRT